MQTNTTSQLPAVIEKAVQPKPTKTEILEALVKLRVEEIARENLAGDKKRDAMNKKIQALILKLFKKNYSRLATVYNSGFVNNGRVQDIEVRLNLRTHDRLALEIPAPLVALLTEYSALPLRVYLGDGGVKEIRNGLRDKINNRVDSTSRITELLTNPDSRKALESLLSALTATKA